MSGYIDEDEDEGKYTPASDPGANRPGGDRVTFEREGNHEQFLGGGGAQDIEASIMESTGRNVQLIGSKIVGIRDVVGAMGSGTVQELELQIQSPSGKSKVVRITGIGLEVQIS